MATFATSQEWLNQCSLLLEARPQTTKISCRYSVKPKPARRVSKKDKDLADAPPSKTTATATTTSQNPRARLVLKAVDPASGVCLRYTTTKAAEVSRLVQLLGQLGRRQAGLSAAAAGKVEEAEDVVMADAAAAEPAAASTPVPAAVPAQGGGGGKGKKKKGKR